MNQQQTLAMKVDVDGSIYNMQLRLNLRSWNWQGKAGLSAVIEQATFVADKGGETTELGNPFYDAIKQLLQERGDKMKPEHVKHLQKILDEQVVEAYKCEGMGYE